jgi:hypothetical protein
MIFALIICCDATALLAPRADFIDFAAHTRGYHTTALS